MARTVGAGHEGKRTVSETLFERFCAENGLTLVRIDESDTSTPDYWLKLPFGKIVVEVKEFQPNAAERESDRRLRETGVGTVLSTVPGARVRKKISEASPQIKARTQGMYPSILVLFDRGRMTRHLDPYNLRTAMYGLEQVRLIVPRNPAGPVRFAGISHGPGRKMTPEDNTSISALGALWMSDADTTCLDLHHNLHAAVPLPPKWLAQAPIREFRPTTGSDGGTHQWEGIDL